MRDNNGFLIELPPLKKRPTTYDAVLHAYDAARVIMDGYRIEDLADLTFGFDGERAIVTRLRDGGTDLVDISPEQQENYLLGLLLLYRCLGAERQADG